MDIAAWVAEDPGSCSVASTDSFGGRSEGTLLDGEDVGRWYVCNAVGGVQRYGTS